MANRFLNNIRVNDSYTLPADDGSDGQAIITDGSGNLSFGAVAAASADKALSLTLTVKNTESVALTKGQVVCAAPSSNPPSGNVIEVKLADNNGTNSMPAIGVLNEGLDAAGGAGDEGEAIMFGRISGINTSAFSVGDEVFVSDIPGGLTITKPTGVKYIQKIGVVMRDDATNGTIEVFGAGRTNDVPTPLYIDHTNQRLGIGTTSPSTKLDVNGNIVADNLIIADSIIHEGDTDTNISFTNNQISTNVGGDKSLRFGDNSIWLEESDSSNYAALIEGVSYGARFTLFGEGNATISLVGDGPSYIKSGDLGIGTYDPDTILHVTKGGSGEQVVAIFENDTNADETKASIQLRNGQFDVCSTKIISHRTGANVGADLTFELSDNVDGSFQERMRITETGSVGIGTTSPSSLLHLYSNAPVISGTSTNNSSGLRYNTVGTAGDTHRFQYNGTTQLNIKNSGNVGIGTTSPSEKLDVSGNANITGNITVGGNLIVNGTTTTLNTTTVEVEDNILQLNTTQGSPDTATAATSGISVYRGDGITQASLIFNDADDTWDLTNNLVVLGNISAANLSGTNTGDQTLASLGAAAAAHTHTWANINGETANSVNEWGGLRHQTNDGYIDFGPANSNHAHIYTDRPDFYFNKELKVNNERVFHQGYHPNADTLTTARTISLTGDVTGSVSFNGSSDVSINTTVANNSHDHNLIVENGTITFGQGSLQWTDINGTGGTGLAGSAPQNPFNDWHHHIIMNHANSAGYYVDIAASFHYDRLHFRRKAGSTPEDWQEIFHDGYHPNADKWTTARTLTLGGDLTGSVSVDGSANVTLNASVTNDSHTHDGRYYTETESDSRFVNVAGDTMTGNLNLGGNQVFDATQYRLRSGNGYGIRFWDSSSYSIYMSSTGAGRLDTTSDYNMYFKMSDGTNRGFVFMNSTTPVAQIDSTGKIYSEGGLDVDGTYILNGQKGLKVRSIDESNYYSFNDSSTADDFKQQFPPTFTGSVAKVDDSTAPAVGCFEITGSYYSDATGDFVKVDINAEYTFEMYVKYVSGADTAQSIYMGWGMYDSNKSSFGNVQRYWAASNIEVDANSNNSDWILIRGTISGVGSSTGQFISGTEYIKPVILTNYNTNTNVIRVCGIRLYKSSQNLTKLQLGRAGAGSSSVFNVNTEYPDARVTLENAGADAVRIRNDHGYIDVGPMNSSHAHIQTDRNNFYFNRELRVDTGRISSYNEDLILATANANTPTDRVFIKRDNGNVGIGTASPAVSLDINATDAIALPTGTTAQRPSSPAAGMFRYNTDDDQFEGYTTEWGAIAGSGSGGGTTTVVVDTFSGDGTDTTFDITNTIADEDNVQIYIDGIYQSKSNYSTSGTTITFSTAPPSGTNNVEVTHFVQVNGDPSIEVDAFNGDGSTTSFTLTTAPVTKNNLQIYIDGVYQAKANYSVSGTSLTFTTAPSTGTNNIEVTHLKIS